MGRAELLFLALLAFPAGGPSWKDHPLAWAQANLASPGSRSRTAARRYLAFREKAARPFLERALEAPDWRAREGALLVLAWAGAPLPPGTEEKLSRDPSWPVRRNLAYFLGLRGEGVKTLKRLLRDPFRDVRAEALLGLASAGALSGATLLAALEDRAGTVRAAALRCLVFAPRQPGLPRAPGKRGGPFRWQALRTLSLRPCPCQIPWLEGLLQAGPEEGTLGEKLLALQVLRPLGKAGEGGPDLVLQGLSSTDPQVRRAALGAGFLLSGRELGELFPRGLRIPGREGFEAFLEISGRKARDLAPRFVPELEKLVRERGRFLRASRWFLQGVGFAAGSAGRGLLEDLEIKTAYRIEAVAELAGGVRAPGLEAWLLRLLSSPCDPVLRDGLLPFLLPFAGKDRVRSFLLSLLPGLPWWRRKAVLEALVKRAGGKPLPALLLPLEKGEIRDPRALADYLEALRDYPPTRRFRDLLGGLLLEESDPRVLDRAARDLARRPDALSSRDLDALENAALRKQTTLGLRWTCLAVLAGRGRWNSVRRILGAVREKEALSLERKLARFFRRKKVPGAEPLLLEWARHGKDRRLELEARLALVSLGDRESWESLLDLSLGATELEAERLTQAFLSAPAPLVRRACRLWSPPSRPPYLRAAAARLAGERGDSLEVSFLERLLVAPGTSEVKAAALKSLALRCGDNPHLEDILEKSLGELLDHPSPQEWGEAPGEVLQEVLAVLPGLSFPWVSFDLWKGLLRPFYQDPLGTLEMEGHPWAGPGRARLEEARFLAGPLFRLGERRLREGLARALEEGKESLGRGLVGKHFLFNLLYELETRPGLPPMPGLAGDLARRILELAPRGGLPDLYALLVLARGEERAGRWKEAAALFRRASRELLLGDLSPRDAEIALGGTDPPRGDFPLLRLPLRPLLLEAWWCFKAGARKKGLSLAREGLVRGRADRRSQREGKKILDALEKPP